MIFSGGSITSVSYVLIPGTPLAGQAKLEITNAPGQPCALKWYSNSGIVTVNSGTASTIATFSNMPCSQLTFSIPIVTATGTLLCF